jgi:streptomycin 6-kinase
MRLRELNELNFSRFDAKLEQRIVELDARLERHIAQFSNQLSEVKADLIQWMFAFWAPTALAVVMLLLRK